jgi:myo-inositol 2-dehydrogenase/D-chiro-inositol 1-dehydrogenase
MRVALIGAGRIGGLHAATLRDLPEVEALLIADADAALARSVAAAVGADAVGDVDVAFKADLDAVVIAAATAAHPELVHMALDARLPVFCEKPVASDMAGTREVIAHVAASGAPLHVGFQRRFDAGYRAVREAVRSGRLGRVHTLRACTSDAAPPATSYLRGSGGIFRDCLVHDFDAIRWVTGREVVEVYATGANRGDPGFTAAGDVDTAAAVLTLDDGTLATVTATRYNGAGYDVRLEACGSLDSVVAGLDDRTPLRPVGSGTDRLWPGGGSGRVGPESAAPQPYQIFLDRFRDAYVAELHAFTEMAAGRIDSPCTAEEALEALLVAEAAELSRRERRPVPVGEVRDAG